ncbi:MAG TPA: hypothetical protein VKV05_11540 [Terriglobales bacterium]|nr:hypothetical protein [Terriglobales bacterium]
MSDLDFSPPPGLNLPLWRSLLISFADRFAPERLPPLELTSKPVDVGILLGERLELPWYRTVFNNLADVISPEALPPLELESRPVDLGELLGDELSHGWWNSLLQNLRDRLSPERLPSLELTSRPVAAFGADASLQILDWSTLIAGPKVFQPDAPPAPAPETNFAGAPAPVAAQTAPVDPVLLMARMQLMRDIGRTCFRRKIWISLAAAETVLLLVALLKMT